MSRFTGLLAVRFTGDRHAILLEDLVWELDHEGSGEEIRVPAGFVSDGATIPRPLWWFMPAWGSRETRATILHDYLLATPVPRAEADRQLYLALRALGVGLVKARVIWIAARTFGAIKEWISSRHSV